MTGMTQDSYGMSFLNSGIRTKIENRKLWYFEEKYREDLDQIKNLQWMDTHTFMLESCLTRADISSMAHSVEVRVPFLDHEIFEFTFGLDPKCYYKINQKKYLQYENLKSILPESILKMQKTGFSYQFFSNFSGKQFEDLLINGHLIKDHILTSIPDFKKLDERTKFHFLMLELWYKNKVYGD